MTGKSSEARPVDSTNAFVKTKRPRLLVLTSTFPRWPNDNIPPFVWELCKRLKNCFDIDVLAPHHLGARQREVVDGIRVTRFRYFLPRYERLAYGAGILSNLAENPKLLSLVPFLLIAQLLAFIRMIRRFDYAAVHAHWIFPAGLIALLGRRFISKQLPLLVTAHGGDLYAFHGKVKNCLKSYVLSRAEAVTVVSRAMAGEAFALGADRRRLQVIPMGVDLKGCFQPPSLRYPGNQVLFVGRLVQKKGAADLITAFQFVVEKHPESRLLIVGEGPERAGLEAGCIQKGLWDRVSFLGAVENGKLPELYCGADIVVFPSKVAEGGDREGFGLVLVEALGCQCAVVASDLSAMQDIVIDGKTGLVVPAGDPFRLANAIIRLLNDPDLTIQLGRQGRHYVLQRFDWEIIAQRYASFLCSTIHQDRAF